MNTENPDNSSDRVKKPKSAEKLKDQLLMDELGVDKEELKNLKKKLAKISPRPEKGVETLFRLVSKNQYTLNSMIDRKSNILISVNALILSIVLGTVLNELDKDPHLVYPAILILATNLISIAYAIFATRPELKHGNGKASNPMFYGNFQAMEEGEYIDQLTELMHQGDELYRTIARDTYHLGKTIHKKFAYLRTSFHIFLIGIVLSVVAFLTCHILFGELF